MQSNWLVEIMKRAQSGPYIKEKDFELALIKRIRKLVKEYGIKYDANTLVPADDDMADRVFEAGLQLFVEFGVYCQSTERQILFSRDEVVDLLSQARSSVVLGTGKDAVVMRHRDALGPHRHASFRKIPSPDSTLMCSGTAGRYAGSGVCIHLPWRKHHSRNTPRATRCTAGCQCCPGSSTNGRTTRHAHQRRSRSPYLFRQDGSLRPRSRITSLRRYPGLTNGRVEDGLRPVVPCGPSLQHRRHHG